MTARILLSLFVLAATLAPPISPQPGPALPQPTVLVWAPATGRQAHVPVSAQSSTILDGDTVVAYEAEITPALLSSLVKSDQAWDSSYSVLVTIWMYYNQKTSGGSPWVSVVNYKTKWQLYDASVSMRNARMNAGCFGESLDGSGVCDYGASQQKSIGTPSSGTTYSMTPSWAGHYIRIVDLNYQAGSSTVQLKRGTTTWWLSICIYAGSCGI